MTPPNESQPTGEQLFQGQFASYTPNANSTTVVSSSVISRLPDEELAALSKVEFQVLLDGDAAGARAGRDMYLGFLISGIIGLIGLLATSNWKEVFTNDEWGTAVWAAVMFAIVVSSIFAAGICEKNRRRILQGSAYSSLINRLKEHFDSKSH